MPRVTPLYANEDRTLGLGDVFATILIGACALASGAQADGFSKIDSKDRFHRVIQGKSLYYPGIKLRLEETGEIMGRALGRAVTGDWTWQSGYFCRNLKWGSRDIAYNCQEVRVNDNKLRFTSDRGAGRSAVLSLR
jgi:hypothetical protein